MVGRLDVDAARISKAGDGAVIFDAPGSPCVVRIRTSARSRGRPTAADLRVTARTGHAGLTPSEIIRLPWAQMLDIASTESAAVKEHPNETYYRMLARPKAPGQRSWDEDHWLRVLEVYEWALASGRPGGGTQAIADLWGVAKKPTAEKWRAEARKRKES